MVIVTTSYFTPGAITTAKGFNIDLWDRAQLANYLGEVEISAVERGLAEKIEVAQFIIQPCLTLDEARKLMNERVKKRAKGGFFRQSGGGT
jgi:hypothetical protein